MVLLGVARDVHELDREIDAFAGRVRLVVGHNVLFAQDRCLPVDQKMGFLVAVGDERLADENAFTRLEFDPERHVSFSCGAAGPGIGCLPASARHQ